MKKTALCVGINNYPGTDSDLYGCVNDAQDWSAVLDRNNFEVVQLLDSYAKARNILEELKKMINSAEKGDSLVFTFSGHGTQVPDEDGDEVDGRDECLCAHDCYDGGLIYDDELWKLFRSKQPGVQIVMISDSCHSGTVARKIGAPILVQQSAAKRKYIPYQLLSPRFLEQLQPRPANPEVARLAEEGSWLKAAKGAARVPWPVLLLSGCQDNEYSYDAEINRRPNGAMTAFALQALNNLPGRPTYNDWFLKLRTKLPSADYPQTPRMIGSYLKQPVFS